MSDLFAIETPRLKLILPHVDYAQEIQAAKETVWDQLQLWLSWSFDDKAGIEGTMEFINERADPASGNHGLIGIEKESGRFVLSTGLHINDKIPPNTRSTGYWVAPDFLGQGFATESTLGVLHYGFGALGLDEMYIEHFEGNDKSRRVIEKCGFQFFNREEEGAVRPLDGQKTPVLSYKIESIKDVPALDVSWNIPEGLKCPA